MDIIKTDIHMDCIRGAAVSQVAMEEDVNLPESKPDISFLTRTHGEPVIEEIKAGNDSVTIRGKLVFHVLYYTGEENEGHLVVRPLIGRYYSRLVQVFEEAAAELGNMYGRQEQFALGLQGLLDTTFLMYCSQSDRRTREITDDTVRSIVQQFMYGIYS